MDCTDIATDAPVSGTVLLVDDDADMLKLTSAWLRSAGFDIRTAGSGADALSKIAVSRPGGVVTDLFMALPC